MKTAHFRSSILVSALVSGCAAASPGQAPAGVDPALAPVAFLEGAWAAERAGETIEEQWTRPAGGTMLATGRTLKGGKTVFFEYLRIEATPAGLVYTAQPLGRPGTTFKRIQAANGEVLFENPEHDFPKRIAYTRRSDGGIDVRIEGERDGRPASEGWVLSRAGAR